MSRSGPALRSEADGFWYFEEHPEVAEYFKQVGVFSYCERLTTFHQQVAEAFALSFDGRIAKVGREEFMIDEASISEYTGCPGQAPVGLKRPYIQMWSSGLTCYQSTNL
jgi:hypothetical protein